MVSWPLAVGVGVLVVVGAGIAWFFIHGNDPVIHRHETLRDFELMLRQLAEQMAEGAVYIIELHGTPAFLQFAKQQGAIVFGFPDAPWSHARFAAVVEAVRPAGLPVEVVSTGDAPVTRFLHVHLAGSPDAIGKAAIQVAALAGDALGYATHADFRGHFEGALDPEAMLAIYGEHYATLAESGPRPFRRLFASQLRQWRAAAGDRSGTKPAA
jgi:hypothetical protein